jgi:PucR C-terminal helix-turn-helix domain/GGDEF-like domain
VMDVAREHIAERERAGRSSEHRLAERVRTLLMDAGPPGLHAHSPGAIDLELGYELEGEHVGVIARGAGAREALREAAQRLDRRLLCVAWGEGPTQPVWAWLGGQLGLRMGDLGATLSAVTDRPGRAGEDAGAEGSSVSFAVGEPAQGLAGWRLTHQQAQAALVVALRRPRGFTRYADVALLASALKDEMLARALIETYVEPLEDARGGGRALRETLRAYIAAGRNVSSTAAALGIVRNTVVSRVRTIEERLGRPLHPCPAELEVALALDELGVPVMADIFSSRVKLSGDRK